MAIGGADLTGYFILMLIGLIGMLSVLSYILIKLLLYLKRKSAKLEDRDDNE